MKKNQQDLILWLQNWYHQYCDGDWEHNETIKICTIDNPGWRITIDLEGTDCENKLFDSIENEIAEDNWYHCFLRNGRFEGAGGTYNLMDILQIFRDWGESCQKKERVTGNEAK